MVITDNVLTQYVNGPDGVLAGVSIYDAMMSFVTDTLPKYKNDPVIVTAMREACHHNLYAIANSCGMNGVGADTTIKVTRPTVVTMSIIIACAFTFLLPAGHRDVDHWRHQVPQDRRIQGLQGFQKIPESL